MKTNDYLLTAGTVAFSFLFYEQGTGLNFLVFNTVIITLFLLRNAALLKSKEWLLSAALCLISAVAIFINGSTLAVFANCVALMVLSARSFDVKTSVIFSLFYSILSFLAVWLNLIMDAIKRNENKADELKTKRGYVIYAWLVVIIFSVFFFFLYKASNPLFAENTKWVNLEFISWQWLLFTTVGFFCIYALLFYRRVNPVAMWEESLPGQVSGPIKIQPHRFELEQYAGTLLFAMLNLMLLILNTGDVLTLWFNGVLPKGVTHSDFVHNGVGIMIFSILLATVLIMYLNRNDFIDVKHSKKLKAFVYLWIAQNLIMIISTVIRNNWYVAEYSLTYKRIGVYVWLLLAIAGLLILFCKLYKNKSNWYLIKSNVATWQIALSVACVFSWDNFITNYNLQNKNKFDVDYFYLLSLSDSNLPQLLNVFNQPDFAQINNKATQTYQRYYATSYQQDFSRLLSIKVKSFLIRQHPDWQSFNLKNQKVALSIKNFKPLAK